MMTNPVGSATRESCGRPRIRVVVADDSAVARQSISGFLHWREDIHLCAVCENGRTAIEQALRDQPDIVLLDLQMPVLSGLEAAQILRSCMPETGVIMMSVHDHPEVRAACLAGGADAFVPKSFLVRQFDAAMKVALHAVKKRAPVLTRERAAAGAEVGHDDFPTPVPRESFRNRPAGPMDSKGKDSGYALPLDKPAPSPRRVF